MCHIERGIGTKAATPVMNNMKTLYPLDIREEELKLKVAEDWFSIYDTTKILGSIDFCVSVPSKDTFCKDEIESLIWGEAKASNNQNIYHSFVQLILTIGKARTFDKHLPPQFLAAFDCEKFAFIPYHAIQDVFYQNDFNWNVTPSDHHSREFLLLIELVEKTLKDNAFIYNYLEDGKLLNAFIKKNLSLGPLKTKRYKVTKNNFTFVYQRWCNEVKKSIQIDWNKAKEAKILDADFFLADLLSKDGNFLLDNLFVLLKHDYYHFDKNIDVNGLISLKEARFNDNMQAHITFWNKYERPPKREYWGYIVARRDLLVPQDIRERRGSFFTPQKWVILSQEYLEKALGEDWQDNYYIWDCCAGTGNLLNGLVNPRRIWASDIDKANVSIMHERIRNGANLLDHHVFQFDFLNDDFEKLPQQLQEIIKDEQKRKKLVIYINPPYAEASDKRTIKGGDAKNAVEQSAVNKKYAKFIGQGNAELFAQFFTRIYYEIPDCTLAEFSKLKILQGPHFLKFRSYFRAKLLDMFIVPANTFDNVKGRFPIGFMIWDTSVKEAFTIAEADVYDKEGVYMLKKKITAYNQEHYMNEWVKQYRGLKTDKDIIGKFPFKGNDFQNQNMIQIVMPKMIYNKEAGQFLITKRNVIVAAVYFAVKKVIPATWINDRDQFLFPITSWENDKPFQLNCLVYTLFTNNIQEKYGTNNWIPFYEEEVDCREEFSSHFMQDYLRDFMAGKVNVGPEDEGLFKDNALRANNIAANPNISYQKSGGTSQVATSKEATNVMNVGRKIWQYYFEVRNKKGGGNVNASLYDIKYYFKGENERGIMNASSSDATFNQFMEELRCALQKLAERISVKIYEHGFLVE